MNKQTIIKDIITILLGCLSGGIITLMISLLLVWLLFLGSGGGLADLAYGLLIIILLYPLGIAVGAGIALYRISRRRMLWKAIIAAYLTEIGVLILAEPLHLNLNITLLMSLILLLPICAVMVALLLLRQKNT